MLAVLAAGALCAAPRRPQVARVVTHPTGATLAPGEGFVLTAEALDRNGNVLDVPLRLRNQSPTVASLDPDGTVAALQPGATRITVSARGKKAVVPVTVRNPAEPLTAAASVAQINDILLDGDTIYWTEVDGKQTRIRRSTRFGGIIEDLVAEPSRDRRGVRNTYVHLQQTATDLYFSRQSAGFLDHFSLWRLPKAGGTPTLVLKEDVGVRLFLANAWRVTGDRLVAVLLRPEEIGLPAGTRVAVYDPATSSWSRLLSGQFREGEVSIAAVLDGTVFMRGETEPGDVKTISMAAAGPPNAFTELNSRFGRDQQLRTPGACDGVNLYFWSERDDAPRLLALPVSGGPLQTLQVGAFGPGLATDGLHLYWARNGLNLVRMSVTGGPLETLLTGVFDTGVFAGVALGSDRVYVPRKVTRTLMDLVGVAK